MSFFQHRSAGFWLTILGGTLIVSILSLSMHVIMLQVLGVPFPDRSAVAAWASFLNTALAVAGLAAFCDAAAPRIAAFGPWICWLIVSGLFGALKELVRGGLMNGVVTTGWIFSLAQLIAPILYSLALGALVVFALPRLRGTLARNIGILLVATIMSFAVKPISALLLSPLMLSISGLSHADVYPFPYGAHVLLWAYITYLEPVIACFVAAALALPGLSPRLNVQAAQFTLMIMAIKGALLPTFLFGFFNKLGVATGALSESQFLLEALLLALPVALIWSSATPTGSGLVTTCVSATA